MKKLKKSSEITKDITFYFIVGISMLIVPSLKHKDYETALLGIAVAVLLIVFVTYRKNTIKESEN